MIGYSAVIGGICIMVENTSIFLGDHFKGFVERQVRSGRYGFASEVVRASLRLLDGREQRLEALRQAPIEVKRRPDRRTAHAPLRSRVADSAIIAACQPGGASSCQPETSF